MLLWSNMLRHSKSFIKWTIITNLSLEFSDLKVYILWRGGLKNEERLQMFIRLSLWSCWAAWFNQLVRLDRIYVKINILLHVICKCAKQGEKNQFSWILWFWNALITIACVRRWNYISGYIIWLSGWMERESCHFCERAEELADPGSDPDGPRPEACLWSSEH